MGIVFLVLAQGLQPLQCLARLLGADFDGLVHVDARTPLGEFERSLPPRFQIIKERLPVFLGRFQHDAG
jgi:hypothetical protein